MKLQAGTKTVNKMRRFPGLKDEVWVDLRGDDLLRSFDKVAAGLYICDLNSWDGYILNTTSDPRASGFSARQIWHNEKMERLCQIMCASALDMRLMA